jgi:hypothetical protein
MQAAVRDAAATARRQGLVSEADVRTFVVYRIVLRVRVEETEEFRAVILDSAVDPNRRMLALAQRTNAAYWRRHRSD